MFRRMTSESHAAANALDGQVRSVVENGVATISFHHPRGNSLTGVLLTGLAKEITTQGANPDAAVIVLRSDGSGPFCGGASFDELKAIKSAAAGTKFFGGFARVIMAMIRTPKFVLTRVQGKVAGGGVGLVAASDYALAVRSAPARLSELAVGLGPFIVGLPIEHKIGLAAFSAMAVDAEWRTAEWCERHGLYSRLYDDTAAMDAGMDDLAQALANSNREAMVKMKEVLWAGTERWEQVLAERAAMSGRLVLSDFSRKAIARFVRR